MFQRSNGGQSHHNLSIVIDSSPLVPQVVHCWHLLVGNILKLNFDGSSLGNLGQLGIGGSIYDASGTCIVAYLGPLGHGDSFSVDIKSLLFGLRLIHSKGVASHNIEVEGYSTVVIGRMGNGSP